MDKSGYFRLFSLSILVALLFGILSFFGISWLAGVVAGSHRGELVEVLAGSIEHAISDIPFNDLKSKSTDQRLRDALQIFPTGGPPPGPVMPPPKPSLWLVSEEGDVLFADDRNPLSANWTALGKPKAIHDLVSNSGFLPFSSETIVFKLAREPAVYLVIQLEPRRILAPLLLTQAVITFGTLFTALFFSFAFTFYYLRRKSKEARAVLLRLERGDLKARFVLKRFDEFGGLILDFNRMAEAIDHLVLRVRTTESARKNLLQELGHDLRTPLTSLKASFEVLKLEDSSLSGEERSDLFEMISAEVDYLTELLENLMVIASLKEPNYKASAECIDVGELVREEISRRNLGAPAGFNWIVKADLSVGELSIFGDYHMIQRLIRNALDNASRFAKSSVIVSVSKENEKVVIKILDDGAGLSQAALASFGKRQEQRSRRDKQHLNFSLGLGSVIMRAIAELHYGTVDVENLRDDSGIRGALITVKLPAAKSEILKVPN